MFLICFLIYMSQEQTRFNIELHGKAGSYTSFSLVHADERMPFNEAGTCSVSIGNLHESFEIIGPEGRVWFLGVWSQYQTGEPIEIDMSKPGFAMYELVSVNRVKQLLMESPAEVTVFKPDAQPEKISQTTTDLLKENPQVHLQKTNLGGGSPIIRGMSGNRVLYLVDGFKINNGTFRLGLNQYLNTVPSELLEQVEVLGGPSGVQYGSDGLGGVVHMLSKNPLSRTENMIGFSEFLSTADGTHIETLNGHWHKGRLALDGHVKWSTFKDLRAGSSMGIQTPTGFEQVDGSMNLGFSLTQSEQLLFTNLVSSADDVPRTDRIWSGKDLLWTYDPQRFRLHGIKLKSDRSGLLWDSVQTGLAWTRQEEGRNRISVKAPELLEHSFNRVDSIQANTTFTKFIARQQLIYGFDFQSDGVSSWATSEDLVTGNKEEAAPKFPNDSAYSQMGAFAIGNLVLTDQISLRTGLRYSRIQLSGSLADPIGYTELDNDSLSPVFSFSFKNGTSFYSFSANHGFRSPNLEDALSIGFSNKGFDAPNPELQPETVWNYDFTYRFQTPGRYFQGTVYKAFYDDLIERVPSSYNGDTQVQGEDVFMMDNVGKAEVMGAGFSFFQKLPGYWTLKTDLSYTKGTQTDRHEPMTRIPPMHGHIQFRRERDWYNVAVDFDIAGKQDRLSPDDLNDSRIPAGGTPAYLVFHLRSSWKINPSLSFSASLENLGDVTYRQHGSGIYEPGRRIIFLFKVKR